MNSPKVEIRLNKPVQSKEKIIIGVNEIPFPTAIFFNETRKIILNKFGYKVLGLKDNEDFDLESWKSKNNSFIDIILNRKENIISNQKAHIVLPNGKHEIMIFSMTHVENSYLGNIYIINFTKSTEKYTVSSLSSLYNIQNEISQLKPYLNRAGKNKIDSLMKKHFRDESQQLTLDDIVYYKKELRKIQQAFPSLSHREVILCGLLVNDMETKNIALITNRTVDSIFVTIHRINKKLNFLNKKDLMDNLKEVVFSKEKTAIN